MSNVKVVQVHFRRFHIKEIPKFEGDDFLKNIHLPIYLKIINHSVFRDKDDIIITILTEEPLQ